MTKRRSLSELGPPTGKKDWPHGILHRHGLGNRVARFLPYDQGLAHGPRDFFASPAAADPADIHEPAVEGRFNGIALQVGTAPSFFFVVDGDVPLVLKFDDRTKLPPRDAPFAPLTASVRDAVRLGTDAVGHTLCVGWQAGDFVGPSLLAVREDAQSDGMPVVVLAYPLGCPVAPASGQDIFHMVDCAPRTAAEPGAAIVKVSIWQRGHVVLLHVVERLSDVLSCFPSGAAVSP